LPQTMRLNMLDRLSLETLSSQVLEFEGKTRADPIWAPFRCFLMGKLLLFPSNVILHWKVIAGYKHCSLFCLIDSYEGKMFYNIDTRCWPWIDRRNKFSTSLISFWLPHIRSNGFCPEDAYFYEYTVKQKLYCYRWRSYLIR
jgi:hypothetical protein